MPRHRRFLSLWVTTGLVIGVGGAVFGLGGAGVAQACSCVGFTDDEAFEAADVVFVGSVVDVDDPGMVDSSLDPKRYTVEVSDVYKGEASARQDVVTAVEGASCGADLGGGPWLVFGRAVVDGQESVDGEPDARTGDVRTSLCSGNRAVAVDVVPASFGSPRAPAAPDTTLPTDAPTSGKNSTAGLLVLIGVVVIVGTGALVLTLKYRKR